MSQKEAISNGSTQPKDLKLDFLCFSAAAGPGNKPNFAQRELKLVQSKKDIEEPEICMEAEDLYPTS